MRKILFLLLFPLFGFSQIPFYGYDPHVQVFIDSLNADTTGVKLTKTDRFAANYLVSALKSIGVYNDMVAIYPMMGATAFKCKWNLKDVRNLDAAYRLTPIGAGDSNIVYSQYGIDFQGYLSTNLLSIDTHIVPATIGYPFSMGLFTHHTQAITGFAAGASDGYVEFGAIKSYPVFDAEDQTFIDLSRIHTSTSTNLSYTSSDYRGFAQGSCDLNNFQFLKDDRIYLTQTSGTPNLATSSLFLGIRRIQEDSGSNDDIAMDVSSSKYRTCSFAYYADVAFTEDQLRQINHIVKFYLGLRGVII